MKKYKFNPNFRKHIDENFIGLLSKAIIDNEPIYLSDALVYKNIGFEKCDDCDDVYWECCCEGDRNTQSIKGYNLPCENCLCNYCLCDYDIDKNYNSSKDRLLGKIVIDIAEKYLSINQLLLLRQNLHNSIKPKEYIEPYIFLINNIIEKNNKST